jgi:hypothetical protein
MIQMKVENINEIYIPYDVHSDTHVALTDMDQSGTTAADLQNKMLSKCVGYFWG